MDPQMKQKCDTKLRELQQNMPFLLKVLERLRNNNLNDPARQTQLDKIQKLYNLLNDKSQTFKWELLVKCENVVNKLQRKMELQGEAEYLLRNSVSPVQKPKESPQETEKSTRDDLACPESPTPQQEEEYFENRQPVVIPTERRCSPPPALSRSRENRETRRSRHDDERKEGKHKSSHHRRHDHHHHRDRQQQHHDHHRQHHEHNHRSHQHRHSSSEKRSSHHERRSFDESRERNSRERNSREKSSCDSPKSNSFEGRDRNIVIDQYLSTQRKRLEEDKQKCFHRRSDKYDPFESPNPFESHPVSPPQRVPSVFSRLGDRVIELSSDDDVKNEGFNRMGSRRYSSSSSTLQISSNRTSLNDTKPLPNVSDFLKSPPLSANDISQLLNEANTNSNSNSNSNPSEFVGISEIGTRRQAPTTSSSIASNKTSTSTSSPSSNDTNANLDFVRKKFALLTKTETTNATSTATCTSSNSEASTFRTTPPQPPSERVAAKYSTHSHVGTQQISTHPSNFVPNSSVNVLPTLRPNDPRLRKSSNFTNGNPSNNLLTSNNNNNLIRSLDPRQSNAANALQYSSSIPNYSPIPNTPSPIYGGPAASSSTTSRIPSASETKINDPRLQRSRTPFNSTQTTRSLLVPADSSDENWDLDDNASDVVFPQPRPFPTRNPIPIYGEQTRYGAAEVHHLGNAHALPRRQSFVWDNVVSPTTNKSCLLPNPEDHTSFLHSNWHGMPPSPSPSNERLSSFQSNPPNERSLYSIPRTYGAYKEARARAAAEQAAARRATGEIKPSIETNHPSTDLDTSPSSSLNTMYRNHNLTNQELPKSMESFKIPKKGVVPTTAAVDDDENPDEKLKTGGATDEKEKTTTKSCEKEMEKNVEKKTKKSIENEEKLETVETSGKESEPTIDISTLSPKPQRERFRLKKQLPQKPDSNKDSPTTTAAPTTKTLLPGRITRRRATMIDKASAPQVDKEKLSQANAMLFEDLQERERKNKAELAENKAHAHGRKYKEICFDKTDDGCTVSTQNIITGKRRTRTTVNFNEVQQGITVFKHLKTSEQKKETTTKPGPSPSPSQVVTKERKKRGPKPKTKPPPVIKTEQINEDKPKPVKETASKVRKRRGTHVDQEIKAKIKKEPVDVVVAKEENQQKSEKTDALPNVNSIFDTFIQRILNPSASAEDVIDKLRDILSEREIESLLTIRESMMKKKIPENSTKDTIESKKKIEKASKKRKSENVASDDVEEAKPAPPDDTEMEQMEEDEETEQMEAEAETAHMRSKAPRRNELDRLHEDIRDMFISEGVLTATGKRMCTFVEPGSTGKPTEGDNKSSPDLQTKSNSTQQQPPTLPHLRKSRVLLQTLNMSRRSMRKQQQQQSQNDSADESDENLNVNENSCSNASFSSDNTLVSSITGANFSTVSSVNTDVTDSSFTKSDNEPLARTMPALKPVKPIRLREEDELDEWLAKQKGPIVSAAAATTSKLIKVEKSMKPQKRYRPCPRSKKPAGTLFDDDNDATAADDECGVSEKVDRTEVVEGKGNAQLKIKTETLDISVPFEDISPSPKDTKTPLNINPKWHWMSRYAHQCVLCKKKIAFASPHYKKFHTENYISRLAPSVLHELRQETTTLNRPIFKFSIKGKCIKNVLLFRCPFCFQYKNTSPNGWMEHFLTHTGEYFYECRMCHNCYNKPAAIEKHMKDKCAALGGRYLHNDEFNRSFKDNAIKAHVCHLCNYLRLGRVSLERHYMEQHGYDVKLINDSLGYTINLIKSDDVPTSESFEQIVELERELNLQSQLEVITLSDTDDEMDIDEGITKKGKERKKSIAMHGKASEVENVNISSAMRKELPIEKSPRKENANKSPSPTKKPTEIATPMEDAMDGKQSNHHVLEVPKPNLLATPISSAFLSTTDDSNDGEAPTVFARKLLTVDSDTDMCTNSPTKPRLSGNISMAERLSQRLKEAEANSANNLANQRSKEVEKNTPNQSEEIISKENSKPQMSADDDSGTNFESQKQLEPQIADKETTDDGGTPAEIGVLEENYSKDAFETVVADESDEGEIDLTIQEDDDDWEDIEIVETAPSAASNSILSPTTQNQSSSSKDLKAQKSKKKSLHKVSRFYAMAPPFKLTTKKSKHFKPLHNISSDSAKERPEETPTKTSMENAISTAQMTSENNNENNSLITASSDAESIGDSTSSAAIDFRPNIPNLDDLLPDSPCNDPIEIVPELAPSGPLKELNDITKFLGSNLTGLLDIDVEEPADSVCIHNNDNQQTSIQEALDFVASQAAAGYDAETNLDQTLEVNSANSDCLNFGVMNRIQNIGYTCADTNPDKSSVTTYRFYCFSDRCTFLYSSEAIGLENHFILEHPKSNWNGYCNTCGLQIIDDKPTNELTFSDEFKHLLDAHIKQPNLTLLLQDDNDAPTTEVAQNKSNGSSTAEQQPRLKIRRLSGDCLSSNTSLQATESSSSSNLIETIIGDSNSFSDLIHFNARATTPVDETIIPTSVECLSDGVPYFTNISKDFQITSISSGLEPTELSAIVKSALSVKGPSRKVAPPNISALQISNVMSLANNPSPSPAYLPISEMEKNSMTTSSTGTSFPKITNVCSLSSPSVTKKIGAIWSEQINEERAELEHAYNESFEVSAILANNLNQRSKENGKESQQRDTDNDSPGPMIVSETLPTGQAMSGNFVITQTVSAQYAEETTTEGGNKPKLGFNISISSTAIESSKTLETRPKGRLSTPTPFPTRITASTRSGGATPTTTLPSTPPCTENVETTPKAIKTSFSCMEPGCKFTSHHFVAIFDHIKWHEQNEIHSGQEYLQCSVCKQKLSTTDAYTSHIRSEHFAGVSSPVPSQLSESPNPNPNSNPKPKSLPVASCALTQKIRNILSKNQVDVTSKDNPGLKDIMMGATKSVDGENSAPKQRLIETIKEIVAKTGICVNDLYRCLVKGCNVRTKESSYHVHVLYHLSTLGASNKFNCPHCNGKCQTISSLKTHIKSHKRHNIFCYICMETAAYDSQMSRHFAQKHWHKKDLCKHILVQEQIHNGNLVSYYVTNFTPLNESSIREFGKKLVIEWQRKQAASRTHFNPDEVDLLPIQAIFSKEIYCSICLYKTKVRTNMVRHMIQHKNMATCAADSTMGAGKAGTMNHSLGEGNVLQQTLNTMIVSSMDPINPVPCLNSNEKHFDRMTNLASSSLVPTAALQSGNSAGSNAPTSLGVCRLRYKYVPETKRYQCGIPGCKYLTINEDMFRAHLHALHAEQRFYQCQFCSEELCKRTLSVERIVQHLRFHDHTLYQCEVCDHSHYIRHIVDRHALEKHGLVQSANILMFYREEEDCLEGTKTVIVVYGKKKESTSNLMTSSDGYQNPNTVGGAKVENSPANDVISAKDPKKVPKYICHICEHKTITHNQIVAHANSQHGIKKPYQCSSCLTFTEWSESNVLLHMNEVHPGEIIKVNKVFGKMSAVQMETNVEEPPRPLWKRDDPMRARQIRGIPMEDEEESEKLRKRLRLSEDFYDDDDEEEELSESSAGRSRGKSSPVFFLNRYEFGCFHCEYKTRNLDELRSKHWESTHNKGDGLTSKPFLFRLLVRLKCAECQNFSGCFWEIQKHMTEDHAKPTSHAMDPRSKKLICGYCEYDCNNTLQLLRHHLRDDHQPQDVKGLFSTQMAKVMRLQCSSPIMYVHCTLCSELFNSRLEVVQHAAEKHTEETEHFSFRELRNTTIYRCPDCFYTSTDEMTTLRHMVNHYRRFKRCHFCNLAQSSFNDYMQHCYSEHRAEIRRFSEIYPLNDIRKYFMQILIIFPNGWIINKKNLRHTPYGNEERIKLIYAEICKTSQEPPIPRLSIGRLVARMSVEAKQQNQNEDTNPKDDIHPAKGGSMNPSSKKQLSSQKIAKRRSTFAVGGDDGGGGGDGGGDIPQNGSKKLKPFGPNNLQQASSKSETEAKDRELVPPYSYYGQRPETEDWSKLHTRVSIAGADTRISLDKFKILFKIDAQVVLEKIDVTSYELPRPTDSGSGSDSPRNQHKKFLKACPASQKYRFV